MRYLPLLLLLSFFSFALPACAQKATTTQKTKTKKLSKKAVAAQARATNDAAPVLTFERTPCFGTCPAYSMKVFADGRVAYEGRHAVPMMGPKELKLPASAVADMLHQTQEAHFDQFQASYLRGTTDLPSTIIGVKQPNGQFKSVTVEEGAPDNVKMLVTYLSNQFDALAQLNGAEK
ncbi:DUF6438 domain-containing protein [Hymenobacter terricola]|uniref:DUF6438 domain-containing protein n=1 Tax=Hymenobacter terricola TaxID=2819236 RepID=UPI001B309A39|nr:DUF6438 domain-containing protein [Hymenobacter terricola]